MIDGVKSLVTSMVERVNVDPYNIKNIFTRYAIIKNSPKKIFYIGVTLLLQIFFQRSF